MKGYKGFRKDLTCSGFQYETGKIHEISGELKICQNGFHFCKELKDCLRFYNKDDNRYFEVEVLGDVVDDLDGVKSVTNKIKLVKEAQIAPEMLIEMSKDEDPEIRTISVYRSDFPPDRLDQMWSDSHDSIRWRVAIMSCNPEVLERLSNDESAMVRGYVAENKHTYEKTISRLSKDETPDVRACAARNPNIPIEDLISLAEDFNCVVRCNAAQNERMPQDVLKRLAESKDNLVRFGVASNSNTPVETLVNLSKDDSLHVRKAVADHHSTPDDVLSELLKDSEADVRVGAVENLESRGYDVLFSLKKKDL